MYIIVDFFGKGFIKTFLDRLMPREIKNTTKGVPNESKHVEKENYLLNRKQIFKGQLVYTDFVRDLPFLPYPLPFKDGKTRKKSLVHHVIPLRHTLLEKEAPRLI